jgi:hypothetical protein
VDVFWFTTFRLLSENLLLFLLPAFYLLLFRAIRKNSIVFISLAGMAAALCALCRQNLILLGPAIGVLLFFFLRHRRHRLLFSFSFLLWFCVIFSLLPLRNYAVTRQFTVPVIYYTTERVQSELQISSALDASSVASTATRAFVYFGKRLLFCAGFTTVLGLPFYYLKPHWMIIWGGALFYILKLMKRPRNLEFWEVFALVFIPAFLAPLIAIATIYIYGVRMIVPVMPVVLLLAVSAWPGSGLNQPQNGFAAKSAKPTNDNSPPIHRWDHKMSANSNREVDD